MGHTNIFEGMVLYCKAPKAENKKKWHTKLSWLPTRDIYTTEIVISITHMPAIVISNLLLALFVSSLLPYKI